MGVFDDILGAIFGSGSTGSTDSKSTEVTWNDDEIKVRNTSVIVDHGNKSHDTIWSTTEINPKTGDTTVKEGGHGGNFDKSK